MEQEKRIDWIDACKGCTIILVVLGHCITRMGNTGVEGIVNLLIYSFHMPLFFFVSGINLNLGYSFKVFIIRKIRGIIIPGYFFSALLLFYKIVTKQEIVIVAEDIYHLLLFTNKSIIGEYWFLPALFIGEIISYLVFKKVKRIEGCILITFLIVIIGLVEKKVWNMPLPFCIEVGAVAYLFIALGYLCREKKNIIFTKIRFKSFVVVGMIFMVGNVLQYLFELGKVNFNSLEIRNIGTFLLNSLSGIFINITIAKKIDYMRIINYVGKKSLYVFGFHYIFLELCCRFDEMIKGVVNIKGTSVIFSILIMLLCYYLCKIIDRIKR